MICVHAAACAALSQLSGGREVKDMKHGSVVYEETYVEEERTQRDDARSTCLGLTLTFV